MNKIDERNKNFQKQINFSQIHEKIENHSLLLRKKKNFGELLVKRQSRIQNDELQIDENIFLEEDLNLFEENNVIMTELKNVGNRQNFVNLRIFGKRKRK